MTTTLTSKGQVTIPKRLRDTLGLKPGSRIEFAVNQNGEVVLHKSGRLRPQRRDRFESARGKAQVQWRSDELMELLRH